MKPSAVLCGIAALWFSAVVPASDWMIVGAGNATCTHWKSANLEQQTEILSWMTGFSSAENLDRSAENKPTYRLEYITYDYLRGEIRAACSEPNSENLSMSSILVGVLQRLPVQQK